MDTPQRPDGDAWASREHAWKQKLGRLKLGAEPLEDQLARYRRVTLVLTAIPALLSLMFVALFAAFGRPDVGVILAIVLFAPIVAVAWLDQGLLERRARAYLREQRESAHGRWGGDPSGTEKFPTGPGAREDE